MATKRALIVGIEKYANPRNDLHGVGNDVASAVELFGRYGITDIQVIRDANATSEAIKTGLNALLSETAPGDVRAFYFSGHGTPVPAGMAGDKQSEGIVPYEGTTDALIMDSWIQTLMRQKVSGGKCNYYGLYDCCNSGELYKPLSADDEVIKQIDFSSLAFAGRPQYVPMFNGFGIKQIVLEPGMDGAIHFGASEPNKQAVVLEIEGKRQSVFTWALSRVLTPGITVGDAEEKLVQMVASQTKAHTPYVACAPADKERTVFD